MRACFWLLFFFLTYANINNVMDIDYLGIIDSTWSVFDDLLNQSIRGKSINQCLVRDKF
jgi:hypothetical protein